VKGVALDDFDAAEQKKLTVLQRVSKLNVASESSWDLSAEKKSVRC